MVGSPPHKTLREQKRELTRLRLLDAALETFHKNGYVQTTAEDIASAAGCSRATFYLHFNSKSAVMIGILERMWPDSVRSTESFADALLNGITRDDMRAEIRSQLATWNKHMGALSAFTVASATEPDVAAWRDDNLTTALTIVARRSGHRNPLSEDVLARMAILERMTHAAFELSTSGSGIVTDEQIVDYLSDLWTDLVGHPAWRTGGTSHQR
ncbi:TetR/AcrR family transcriptional regulator [Streptomyces muensis]|uniref:TetR/AcrR family transcriptional regulator n=1 Tax=Streptomyces muensis TaxID=1077944 RepID=A0A9X1PU49_STRM4|nr:TetR/AcrR family transcriptional regulator [Streptomyces muensis]MCF1592304.1 TetR/AcrR family transcriptional regulator [Streptomyces muensis]